MNPQKLRLLFFAAAAAFCFVSTSDFLSAQSQSNVQENDSENVQPGQLTFVTPLGTNGKASRNTINNFSINLLIGSSAGVRGAEMGGLINRTYGALIGAQFAGLANCSYKAGIISGAQFAGLINKTSSSMQGFQTAGLININNKQGSIADSLAAFEPYFTGMQISGLININATPLKGVQVAGLLNRQDQLVQGLQLAGIVNLAPQITGAQLSGIINKTKRLSGVQIGLINIADTVDNGVQIGLINIAKNGHRYRATEVEFNESFYANINYKMGIKRFYTIFSLAFGEKEETPTWAPGFGFGTYVSLSRKVGLNIDAISYQVNEDEWWTDGLNQLNKLRINGSYEIAPILTVYGGFSLNVLISELEDAEGNLKGSVLAPKETFLDEEHSGNSVIIYPGFNVGIRF